MSVWLRALLSSPRSCRDPRAWTAHASVLVLGALLAFTPASAPAQPAAVDDCAEGMFLDRTAAGADRSFDWNYSFASDPERCITVRVGQTVRWQGNFGDHPLDADEGDMPNPIASHPNGEVTFTRPGTFGFRCNFHLEMRGAIRVLPAAAVVPWAGISAKTTLAALLLVITSFVVRERRASALQRALARYLPQRSRRWLEPLALLAIASALALALGPARYGSPDSATYLSAAEHLARGHGYVTSSLDEHGAFEPVSCFAPLFPALIALLMTVQQLSARAAMNEAVLASFLLYALACFTLLKLLLPEQLRRWALPVAVCLLFLPGSVICVRSALSDLLGAALALFACAHLLACVQRRESAREHDLGEPTRGWVLRSGALFALAIWARWANLYFALSACAGLLLLTPRAAGLRRRCVAALWLAASVVVLVAPLWLRNVMATGTAMGPRSLSMSDPLLHVQHALAGLAQPLLEARKEYPSSPPLAGLFLAMLLVCSAGLLALWLSRRESATDLGLLLALGYTALLIASSSATPFDSLDHPRFWLPIWPLVLGLALRALCAAGEPALHRPLIVLGSCLVAITTAHAALDVVKRSAHVPPQSGVFAQGLASSEAVHTALGLFDAGRCALSSPHAFWLFPLLGTRPIWWPSEANGRSLSKREPSCVLLLRERADYNTDSARFRSYLERLAQSSRARLLQRDALAELWWTLPSETMQRSAQRL